MTGEELLLLLGKVVRNGHAFEFATCLVLGRCIGLPVEKEHESSILIGQRLSTAARLDLIQELAVRQDTLDRTQLASWLRDARQANDERNRIIHSPWHEDPISGEVLGAITRRGQVEPWKEERIQAAIDATRKAIEGAMGVLGLDSQSR